MWKRSDPLPVVQNFIRLICAHEWNPEIGDWVRVGKDAIANELFLKRISPFLLAYVNHSTARSAISAEEAHKLTMNITNEFILNVGLSAEEYGLRPQDFSLVWNSFSDMIFFVLSRAVGDMERNHEDNTFKATEVSRSLGTGSVSTGGGGRKWGGMNG